MADKGGSFLSRSGDWLRSKLRRTPPTPNSDELITLEPANAVLSDQAHRKSPTPGVGRTMWQMTEWASTLPDTEKTQRLRLIFDRESATHRILCEKANDIFRAGYKIEADESTTKQIEDFKNDTLFEERLREGVICAFWQGNGYLERLFVEPPRTTIDQPPPKTVPIGYRLVDPTRCRPIVNTDMGSEDYDKVKYYMMPFTDGVKPPLKAHPDRILHIVMTNDPMAEDHLGKSEIDAIYDAALNKRVADSDMVQLIHRKAGMIYHFTVKNAQDEDIEGYQAEYGNMTNVTNLVTSEDITIKGVGGDGAIANIEAYLRYFEDQICYGLRYPVSLFRGEGQGSISTADTNLLSYHEHIQSYQRKVEEIMEKEFDVVLSNGKVASTEGTTTYDYEIVWNPLGEKDKKRDADILFAQSQAFTNIVNGGLGVKVGLALVGWDQDLEDMGIKPEEMIPPPVKPSPDTSIPPGGGVSPQGSLPKQHVQPKQPENPMMSKAEARGVISRRGNKESEKAVRTLKGGLGVAILDLARIINDRLLKDSMTPTDAKNAMDQNIPEVRSRNPVDNLFLRAMWSSLLNSFGEGYVTGKEDMREIRTRHRVLMPKMSVDDPKTPGDIMIPNEWLRLYPEEDIKYLQQYTFEFSIQRGQTFERDLKQVLIDGVEQGKGIPQIRRDIQMKAQEMSAYEAERIARTEVIRAANVGRMRAYASEGVEKVEWVAAEDERTCPVCAELDGKEMTIPEVMAKLNHVGHPPIQCRCTTIPIP